MNTQMNDEYRKFLERKLGSVAPSGFEACLDGHDLMPHQRDLARWALRLGRAAIFADTGLGKTRMQLIWAHQVHAKTGGDVLVLAPLAVAAQTVAEGAAIGVSVTHCRDMADVQPGINITNYERLHRFDPSRFVGIVLDESSCIKQHDAKTLKQLLDAFSTTPYRLCATATPAPNDWIELGTHAQFLGICTRAEMLSEYFVHDGGETRVWRLKGHARAAFWRWVSSWGAMVRRPSDLGYDDTAYRLPALEVEQHTVEAQAEAVGFLFALEAQTLSERRAARKGSLTARVMACAKRVNADKQPWVVWCDLNAESEALAEAIPDAVEIRGSDDIDAKEQRLIDFSRGKIRVLVTKPSITAWGVNWQHCARMAFVGVTDSFESYYQAVRRCWRFGQKRPVEVHVYASELEGAVLANLKRKEIDAGVMADALSTETRAAVRDSVVGSARQTNPYQAQTVITAPDWLKTETI